MINLPASCVRFNEFLRVTKFDSVQNERPPVGFCLSTHHNSSKCQAENFPFLLRLLVFHLRMTFLGSQNYGTGYANHWFIQLLAGTRALQALVQP